MCPKEKLLRRSITALKGVSVGTAWKDLNKDVLLYLEGVVRVSSGQDEAARRAWIKTAWEKMLDVGDLAVDLKDATSMDELVEFIRRDVEKRCQATDYKTFNAKLALAARNLDTKGYSAVWHERVVFNAGTCTTIEFLEESVRAKFRGSGEEAARKVPEVLESYLTQVSLRLNSAGERGKVLDSKAPRAVLARNGACFLLADNEQAAVERGGGPVCAITVENHQRALAVAVQPLAPYQVHVHGLKVAQELYEKINGVQVNGDSVPLTAILKLGRLDVPNPINSLRKHVFNEVRTALRRPHPSVPNSEPPEGTDHVEVAEPRCSPEFAVDSMKILDAMCSCTRSWNAPTCSSEERLFHYFIRDPRPFDDLATVEASRLASQQGVNTETVRGRMRRLAKHVLDSPEMVEVLSQRMPKRDLPVFETVVRALHDIAELSA
jgi:hypothetical protein